MRGLPAEPRPVLPLWLRCAMLGALLAALVAATLGDARRGVPTAMPARGDALASRELRFVDLDGGAVSIRDAAHGGEIARLGRGDDGFVRGVMRGLARERRARGAGAATPFRLTLWSGGQLSLDDPATARSVELTAFGPDNARAFARLIGEAAADES